MPKTSTTLRRQLTGADHHCFMLLDALDSGEGYAAPRMSKYLEAARRILQSPNAFNGAIDTLTITDHVLKGDVLHTSNDTDRDKTTNRAIDRILQGDEGEDVTADAWELLMLLHRAIDESALYGAACMYELLEGGTR